MVLEYNIDHPRGDTFEYTLNFFDNTGVAYNLTNCVIFFTLKNNLEDSDADATFKKDFDTFATPTTGSYTIEVTNTELTLTPKLYYYDIQFKTADGKIFTIFYGKFNIYADVTQRTTPV